jgi:hypothetical protein
MNRRRFFKTFAAMCGVGVAGSATHQAWLMTRPQGVFDPSKPLPDIPIIDARAIGMAGYAQQRHDRLLKLRQACLGALTPLANVGVHTADRVARHWLHRSASPYAKEVDAIAETASVSGIHILNTSYEWGCTALASPSATQQSARLIRTLDWPFLGLGQLVEVVCFSGKAGDYWNVTWPGAVGVLTAMAPRRFSASLNQAPMYRGTQAFDSVSLDLVRNAMRMYTTSNHMPALHLLRFVFETAPDYKTARHMLEKTPIANPTIYTLAGLAPDETCVIERLQTDFRTHTGVSSAANQWRYSGYSGKWDARMQDFDDPVDDSRARSTLIETFAARETGTFDWVKPPILNEHTRLAIEADAGTGHLKVRGYEPYGNETAVPATKALDQIFA